MEIQRQEWEAVSPQSGSLMFCFFCFFFGWGERGESGFVLEM